MDKQFHLTLYDERHCLLMLRLKLIPVSKGPLQACAEFIFRKHIENIFVSFLKIEMVQTTETLLSRKTTARLSYIVNTMAADALATLGARSSAAMVLTLFSSKIPECFFFFPSPLQANYRGQNLYFNPSSIKEIDLPVSMKTKFY